MATNVSEMEKAYSEAIEWLIAQALEEESQFHYGGELEYLTGTGYRSMTQSPT